MAFLAALSAVALFIAYTTGNYYWIGLLLTVCALAVFGYILSLKEKDSDE